MLAVVCVSCFALPALAQESKPQPYPRFEIFTGYSAIETTDHSFQFQDIGSVPGLDFDEQAKGVEVGLVANLNRYVGILGSFSAHFSSNNFQVPFSASLTQSGQINPRLFDFLVGPEVKFRNHTRLTPFARAVAGVAHSTATFSTSGQAINLSRTDTETGLAMAIDVGLDIRISRKASFRTTIGHGRAYLGQLRCRIRKWAQLDSQPEFCSTSAGYER